MNQLELSNCLLLWMNEWHKWKESGIGTLEIQQSLGIEKSEKNSLGVDVFISHALLMKPNPGKEQDWIFLNLYL